MQEIYSNIITNFLRSHPAIAPTTLENELSLPNSTIRQALAGAQLIPKKHLFNIICHLADYGLKIDGYILSYNPADGILSGRKWVENIEIIEEGDGFAYIVKEYRIMANDISEL